jgi:cysteine desulfurase/selenocysteine lyase
MALRRELFPVTATHCYLNSAAESPLNTSTHARILEYLSAAQAAPFDKPQGELVRQEVRMLLAELLGGTPEEYCLLNSTSAGINTVALGISWREGDNVVIPAEEHWNNTFPWLELRARGVEVRVAPLGSDRTVPVENIEALLDDRTRCVSVSHVNFATGFRSDLKRLAALAHSKGALLVVDGIQAAGACPVDLARDGVDAYAAGGFKWLLGAPGTGFLFISKAAQAVIKPSAPGMFAAGPSLREVAFHADARRYESGSIAYALFHGWAAGLRVLREVGIAAIFQRNLVLTRILLEGLSERPHIELVSPCRTEAERSQIVVITAGSEQQNSALCARLRECHVIVANRGSTIRVSPNFFNTEEEMHKLLQLL